MSTEEPTVETLPAWKCPGTPDGHHQYRTACAVCKEPGYLFVSIEPGDVQRGGAVVDAARALLEHTSGNAADWAEGHRQGDGCWDAFRAAVDASKVKPVAS